MLFNRVNGKSKLTAVLAGLLSISNVACGPQVEVVYVDAEGQTYKSRPPSFYEEVRTYTTKSVDELYLSQTLDQLIAALRHDNSSISEKAKQVLIRKGAEAVPALISTLEAVPELKVIPDSVTLVRRYYRAIDVLGDIGPPAVHAVPVMLNLLKNKNIPAGRDFRIYEAIAKIKPPVQILVNSLEDGDARTISCIVSAFGKMGPEAKGAVLSLIKLWHKEEEIRQKSILARDAEFMLRNVESALAKVMETDDLVLMMQDKSASKDSRFLAMKVLGKQALIPSCSDKAISALIGTFGDRFDLPTAFDAEEVLSRIGATAVPYLAKALQSDDSNVRYLAVSTCERMGWVADDTIPTLIRIVVHDENSRVRDKAIKAIGNMGPRNKEAVPILISILNSDDTSAYFNAVMALGSIGDDAADAVPYLMKGYMESYYDELSGYVHPMAVEDVINRIEQWRPGSVDVQLAALQNTDQYQRAYAAKSLGDIAPDARKAIPALVEKLSDESLYVRAHAARALIRIAGREDPVIKSLASAAKDRSKYVRRMVAGSLADLVSTQATKKEVITILVGLLQDAWWSVRGAAEYSLSKLGWKPTTAFESSLFRIASRGRGAEPIQPDDVALFIRMLGIDESAWLTREAPAEVPIIKAGWQPATLEDKVFYAVTVRDWEGLLSIGKPAVPTLVNLYGRLQHLIGESPSRSLMEKLYSIGYIISETDMAAADMNTKNLILLMNKTPQWVPVDLTEDEYSVRYVESDGKRMKKITSGIFSQKEILNSLAYMDEACPSNLSIRQAFEAIRAVSENAHNRFRSTPEGISFLTHGSLEDFSVYVDQPEFGNPTSAAYNAANNFVPVRLAEMAKASKLTKLFITSGLLPLPKNIYALYRWSQAPRDSITIEQPVWDHNDLPFLRNLLRQISQPGMASDEINIIIRRNIEKLLKDIESIKPSSQERLIQRGNSSDVKQMQGQESMVSN